MQGSQRNFVVMGRVEALVALLIKRSGISHCNPIAEHDG